VLPWADSERGRPGFMNTRGPGYADGPRVDR